VNSNVTSYGKTGGLLFTGSVSATNSRIYSYASLVNFTGDMQSQNLYIEAVGGGIIFGTCRHTDLSVSITDMGIVLFPPSTDATIDLYSTTGTNDIYIRYATLGAATATIQARRIDLVQNARLLILVRLHALLLTREWYVANCWFFFFFRPKLLIVS